MKLNRKWFLVIALVLSLTMATGGTLAYLTATDAEVNIFTMGDVDIDLTEEFEQLTTLLPGVDVDKKVNIKNTGKNDAWVFATIAVPAQGNEALISLNLNESTTNWKLHSTVSPKAITLDNQNYWMYTYLYEKSLSADETTGTLLESVTLNSKVDYVNGKYCLVTNGIANDVAYDLTKAKVFVNAYAIQKDNFADAVAGYNAYVGQWGNTEGNLTEDNINQGTAGNDNLVTDPDNDSEFEDAVTDPNAKEIYIKLTKDTTYETGAWEADIMGNAATEKIVIDGQGHTLNFKLTDSDWSHIITNGAELVIKNVKLTSSGYNAGHWKRMGINFNTDLILENVISDQGIIIGEGHSATLTDVTINNNEDSYAVWVRPGATVTATDMVINSTGRAFKVGDEDASNKGAKAVLKLTDVDISSAKKAAILVSSEGGADITLKNVDITDVKQDSTNAVWVDEDWAQHDAKVTVTGGTKIVEPKVISTANDLLKLSASRISGNYTLGANIDLDDAEFKAMIVNRGDSATFNGNGYTISNVKVVSGDDDNTTGQASMFYTYSTSTLNVNNLTLKNITVTSDENDSGYAAAVVGYCEGTAVLNNVDVVNGKITGAKSSGMLCGHVSGNVKATNCDLSGSVTLTDYETNGHYAGKYFGTIAGPVQMNNCTANVTVGGKLNPNNIGDTYGRMTGAGSLS